MDSVNIGKRAIGQGESCHIIAEIGINHNGSIDLAHELIRQARIADAH